MIQIIDIVSVILSGVLYQIDNFLCRIFVFHSAELHSLRGQAADLHLVDLKQFSYLVIALSNDSLLIFEISLDL